MVKEDIYVMTFLINFPPKRNIIKHKVVLQIIKGKPLPPKIKEEAEEFFETDFSQVKVHDDKKSHDLADDLDAKAFTTGKDVFFGKDEFKPETKEGKKLIVHELTHVVQQEKVQALVIQRDFVNGLEYTPGKMPKDCFKLIELIKAFIEELSTRYLDMLLDKHGLYNSGYKPDIGDWEGHKRKYDKLRKHLKEALENWEKCGGRHHEFDKDVVPKAREWRDKKAPVRPIGKMSIPEQKTLSDKVLEKLRELMKGSESDQKNLDWVKENIPEVIIVIGGVSLLLMNSTGKTVTLPFTFAIFHFDLLMKSVDPSYDSGRGIYTEAAFNRSKQDLFIKTSVHKFKSLNKKKTLKEKVNSLSKNRKKELLSLGLKMIEAIKKEKFDDKILKKVRRKVKNKKFTKLIALMLQTLEQGTKL